VGASCRYLSTAISQGTGQLPHASLGIPILYLRRQLTLCWGFHFVVQMDWFNSGGMPYGHWKTQFPVPAMPHGPEALQQAGVMTSKGYRLARFLHDEIMRTWSSAAESNVRSRDYPGTETTVM
jgi:hypothetical protein